MYLIAFDITTMPKPINIAAAIAWVLKNCKNGSIIPSARMKQKNAPPPTKITNGVIIAAFAQLTFLKIFEPTNSPNRIVKIPVEVDKIPI